MGRFLLHRLASLLGVLAMISIVAFSLSYLVPGDAAVVIAGPGASQASIERIRKELNLDEPAYVRYLLWLRGMFQGNIGTSAITNERISDMVGFRLVNTLMLTGLAMAFAILVGVLLGALAAFNRNSYIDYLSMSVAVFGISAPVFWVGLVLIYVFAVRLGWVPITQQGGPLYLVLPTITVGMYSLAAIARMTRTGLLEILQHDFIRTARAKGTSPLSIVSKHAMRNALGPVVTVIGLQAGYLMGGAVLTETVFAFPGIGRLFADAVFNRDFPLIQVLLLLFAAAFAIINLLVDLTHSLLDPRLSYG